MATSAEAPLMSHQEDAPHETDSPRENDISDGEGEETARQGSRNSTGSGIGFFMWLLTFSAGISGLLFGYDTGVISATLVSVGTSLSGHELTLFDKSVVTSCTALFALIASPLSSILADHLGRKPVILIADMLFVVGALVQACSFTVFWMVVGRSVVGAAVGAASFVTPLYIAELAPAAYRGRLVTMNVLSITMGQVVAYIIGWAFAEHGDPATGWRYMVGLGAVPAVIQCVLLLFMPDTPRWLVKAGKSHVAKRVIRKTLGLDAAVRRLVEDILKDIEFEVREEEENSLLTGRRAKDARKWLEGWHELVTVPKNRRALTIACLLQGLQQLCGFNSLMYFSATIFTLLGFAIPTLISLSVAATNFVFTVVALLLVDRIGRRRILLYSVPLMVIGLFLSAFGFRSIRLPSVAGVLEPSGTFSEATAATVVLMSMMIYVAAYALGLGNVPWMQSELFPLNVRSLGSGVATATNWSANFVIGLTFLAMMDALTPAWTFVLYGAVCALGWGAIWLIYPETSGLSLEEATGLLEHGWGVR